MKDVYQAITRLEGNPHWETFVGHLEYMRDDCLETLMAVPESQLPAQRARLAELVELVKMIKTAAETAHMQARMGTPRQAAP